MIEGQLVAYAEPELLDTMHIGMKLKASQDGGHIKIPIIGKAEILAIDAAAGTFTFLFIPDEEEGEDVNG